MPLTICALCKPEGAGKEEHREQGSKEEEEKKKKPSGTESVESRQERMRMAATRSVQISLEQTGVSGQLTVARLQWDTQP